MDKIIINNIEYELIRERVGCYHIGEPIKSNNDFILFNEPCLSLNDLLEVWGDNVFTKSKADFTGAPLFLKFKEVAKKKLNL